MNGFEQIKSFYSWVFNNQDRKIRPTHISLYLFLLNQNNRSMWVEWFKCPYDLAMQGACIGNKNTYYKCLDELQMYGLIEYKKGVNNHHAPLIKLIRLYDSVPLTGNVTVPLSDTLPVPVPDPLTVLLNKNTYKLITLNYKQVNNNISKWLSEIEIKKFDYEKSLLEKIEDKQLVQDFILLKKTKKAQLTETAFNSLINECEKNNFSLEEALKICIEKNWQGFKVKWVLNDQNFQKEKSSAQKEKEQPLFGRMTQSDIEESMQGW